MTECLVDLQPIGLALTVGAVSFAIALMLGFLVGAVKIHIGK